MSTLDLVCLNRLPSVLFRVTRHTVASLRRIALAYVNSNYQFWFALATSTSHLELCAVHFWVERVGVQLPGYNPHVNACVPEMAGLPRVYPARHFICNSDLQAPTGGPENIARYI